ncbi:uncharacterized protein LOC131479205 [Ochotona princeps]|uniref:uncharacterized protein LOC131479205 n=1 Tax=Ochotona princeps TaxID=9978 RepID=UPI0027154BFB|nr:uncharacterized protein LOC131479205 [Ochotona princeps]
MAAHHRSRSPSSLPANAKEMREQIIAATQRFFDLHGIRIKVRRLPVQLANASNRGVSVPSSTKEKGGSGARAEKESSSPVSSPSSQSSSSNAPVSLPLYHFITRQKLHMAEQLLRNRSSFITPFNKKSDRRQKASPWVMQEMTDELKKHLAEMSSDFDDREFSGVYLSLHTKPYLVDCEYGNLSRSRFVGWALVELLTTNERCLKALWVHPTLSASSTRLVLQAFIPRILVEAVEFATPGVAPLCPWKFFYAWLNDFDLLPRGTWLLLSSPKYLGLSVHCDNLNQEKAEEEEEEDEEEEGKSSKNRSKRGGTGCKKGTPSKGTGRAAAERGANKKKGGKFKQEESSVIHVGHTDADEGSACPCQHSSRWHDEFDEKLVGCTEGYMYRHHGRIMNLIPTNVDDRLLDDMNALPQENPDAHKTLPAETEDEIRAAETFNLDDSSIERLLMKVWGQWRANRFKRKGAPDPYEEENSRPVSRKRFLSALENTEKKSNAEELHMLSLGYADDRVHGYICGIRSHPKKSSIEQLVFKRRQIST